jgi:hypothetical protein
MAAQGAAPQGQLSLHKIFRESFRTMDRTERRRVIGMYASSPSGLVSQER